MSRDDKKKDSKSGPVDPTRVPKAPIEQSGDRPGDVKPESGRLPAGTPGQTPPPDKEDLPHGRHSGFPPKRKP